jgi:hypothetical protein
MMITRLLAMVLILTIPTIGLAQETSEPDMEVTIEEVDLADTVDNTMIELEIVLFPDKPQLVIDNELQAWLFENDLAPFDGVLLNPEATALILSEYEAQRQRGEAALEKQRQLDAAMLELETGKLRVELVNVKKKSVIQLETKDKENKELQRINKRLREDRSSFWGDVLLVGGGIGLGLLLGIPVFAL